MIDWLIPFLEQHQDSAEFHSLALTWPAIVICAAVVVFWTISSVQAFVRGCVDPIHWINLGIWINFIGAKLDNTYWGIAWASSFQGWPSSEHWFAFGAYPNIFSRQMRDILAGYCHLRAMVEQIKRDSDVNWIRTLDGNVIFHVLLGYSGALLLEWWR